MGRDTASRFMIFDDQLFCRVHTLFYKSINDKKTDELLIRLKIILCKQVAKRINTFPFVGTRLEVITSLMAFRSSLPQTFQVAYPSQPPSTNY